MTNNDPSDETKETLNQDLKLLGEWLPLADYPDYYISSFGHILSTKNTNRIILKQHLGNSGYNKITLRKNGESVNLMTHRLVAKHFIGKCPEGEQVNHIDTNKLNNRLENLEYVNQSQNIRHSNDIRNMSQEMAECYRGLDDYMGYLVKRESLDALVPVWEKLGEMLLFESKAIEIDYDQGELNPWMFSFATHCTSENKTYEDKTLVKAAALATYKAIKELG